MPPLVRISVWMTFTLNFKLLMDRATWVMALVGIQLQITLPVHPLLSSLSNPLIISKRQILNTEAQTHMTLFSQPRVRGPSS